MKIKNLKSYTAFTGPIMKSQSYLPPYHSVSVAVAGGLSLAMP